MLASSRPWQLRRIDGSHCAFGLASCLLFGGGTSAGLPSDALLQLCTIPLLVLSLFNMTVRPSNRFPLAFCATIVLLPLLQLIPLPPEVWSSLPGHAPVAETFALMAQPLPWLPVSVAPQSTMLTALALIPPLAIFLSTLQLPYQARSQLSVLILGFGVISAFIGLIQVAQGEGSSLRFYAVTNPTEAVGFFANRNHFAALLYCLTLFAAAWASHFMTTMTMKGPRRDEHAVVKALFSLIILIVFVAVQATARSRAGLGLTVVALLGGVALALATRRRGTSRTPIILLVGTITIAVLMTVQLSFYRVFERFNFDPLTDARVFFARNTIAAAKTYMPLGSGLGTFGPVYQMFETPADLMPYAFANRAHNDILESWLETGIFGLLLMAVFGVWFVMAAIRVWRPVQDRVRGINQALAQAGSLVIVLLIAHSAVDYPLRTSGLLALFAFACALLIPPPGDDESHHNT